MTTQNMGLGLRLSARVIGPDRAYAVTQTWTESTWNWVSVPLRLQLNGLTTGASSTGFSLTSGKVLQASRIRQGHASSLGPTNSCSTSWHQGVTETYKNSKDQPQESKGQILQS